MRRVFSVFYLTIFTALLFLFSVNFHNASVGINGNVHVIEIDNKAALLMSFGLLGLAVIELNDYFHDHDQHLALASSSEH